MFRLVCLFLSLLFATKIQENIMIKKPCKILVFSKSLADPFEPDFAYDEDEQFQCQTGSRYNVDNVVAIVLLMDDILIEELHTEKRKILFLLPTKIYTSPGRICMLCIKHN